MSGGTEVDGQGGISGFRAKLTCLCDRETVHGEKHMEYSHCHFPILNHFLYVSFLIYSFYSYSNLYSFIFDVYVYRYLIVIAHNIAKNTSLSKLAIFLSVSILLMLNCLQGNSACC